jgi:hypothetical protein
MVLAKNPCLAIGIALWRFILPGELVAIEDDAGPLLGKPDCLTRSVMVASFESAISVGKDLESSLLLGDEEILLPADCAWGRGGIDREVTGGPTVPWSCSEALISDTRLELVDCRGRGDVDESTGPADDPDAVCAFVDLLDAINNSATHASLSWSLSAQRTCFSPAVPLAFFASMISRACR